MLHQRKQEVIDKVKLLTEKANKLYNITLPPVKILFDLRGRCAGIAGRDRYTYYMRFNVDMMQNAGWDHLLNDTVPHELAHVVCFYEPRLGRNHDHGWQRVCRALGGSGERCHNELVTYANGKTFYYTSSTGRVVALSIQRHRKVQAGEVYRFRDGKGMIDKNCQFSTTSPAQLMPALQPAPVAPTPAPVAAPTPVLQLTSGRMQGTGSKADHVRAKIRECKRNGQGQSDAIYWAITALGMSRSLAKTYVQNNWQSVVA